MGEELILFIDGSQERAAVSYNRMSQYKRDRTIWARNVEEALPIFSDYRSRLKVVFLSNDLNEFIHGDMRREDSGAEIVRYLEKQPAIEFSGCVFVVQDHDKKVGEKLTERLKKAGYSAIHKPFGM